MTIAATRPAKLLSIATLTLACVPLSTRAQELAALEEIIVTATKRAEALQDVPLAITALSGDQLTRIGASGFADFYRSAPGLTFNQGDANRGKFSIRGISTGMTLGNTQSTVAVYIDELPTLDTFGASSMADLHLFDIERVEVLRGPQGTLFGSGAMGGAVRVITRKPDTQEFTGAVSTQLDSTRDGDMSSAVNAMVNLPLLEDRLALRVVGYYRDVGGYVGNVGTGERDANRSIVRGGRAALLFEATEQLTLTGSVSYQESTPRDGAALNATVDGKLVRRTLMPEFMDNELTIYNLTAEYDLGAATLFSSSTFAKNTSFQQVDLASVFGTPGAHSRTTSESEAFAQELRLASNGDGPLSWIVGAFYLDRDRDMNIVLTWPGAGAIFGPAFPSDVIYDAYLQPPTTEKALFGEVSYGLGERWEATLGARWFENDSTYEEHTSGMLNRGTTQTFRDTTQRKATPKLLLSYKPGADAKIYAQASQGYRVGQNNAAIPPDPDTLRPAPTYYEADTLWNYELGAKTEWLDGRLIVNGALYYIDWSDIQLDQRRRDNFNYIANIGEAHSMGVELEVSARPLPGLQLSSAVAFTEAQIDEDNATLATPVRKGDRLPGVAEFTISNAIDYTLALRDAWSGYGRLDHQYVGESFDTFDRSRALPMGDYHVVNLRTGVTNDRWELALYARNVLDSNKVVTAFRGVEEVRYLQQPRTLGLEVNVRL
jgi:iron complex outermembrane recepter protein